MSKQIFINLPVADLPKSIAFFEALGFSRNPQMGDDSGACIVVSDTIFVMLATQARFRLHAQGHLRHRQGRRGFAQPPLRESRRGGWSRGQGARRGRYDLRPAGRPGLHVLAQLCRPGRHGWGLFHMTATPAQA
ncbi:VOC family protein [Rhodanobacter umsongensis]|uniref:VOC family protein n=1 Tax=Rhodanobacter umsongensis TaxID=633153 RepID=A0ABW0JHD5_9GAMM